MVLKLLLICLEVHISLSGKILEYKFGTNFGQIFYDYSGNNWHAVNGDNSSTSYNDTKPTDRGAFFVKDQQNRITLPPNDYVTSYFNLGSNFSIVMWVMTGDSYDYTIFNRFTSNVSHMLKIKRSSSADRIWIRFKQNNDDPGTAFSSANAFVSSNLYLGKWELIICTLEVTLLKAYINGEEKARLTLTSEYNENSKKFTTRLGSHDGTSYALEGYMWYFAIFDIIVTQTDYYGGNYITGNCLVNTCPSSCNPSILQNSQQYCLSINFDSTQNGAGNSCPSGCSYGCSNSLCLNCECNYKSCEIVSNQVNCLCPSIATSSQTTCTCPDRYYFSFCNCENCHEECATCSQANICLACIADNSTPKIDKGCKCMDKYYGSSLTTKTSCNSCHEECATCDQANICLTCIADNSTPKIDIGCKCKDKYYGSSLITQASCNPCYKECDTCDQANICLTCIADNSTPSIDEGCICMDKYYGNSLITQASCNPCYEECATCNQANICLTCIADNSTPKIDKGCKCNDKYYGSSLITQSSCNPCHEECDTCDQAYKCLTCKAANASPSENEGCLCDKNYYSTDLTDLNGCASCHTDCQACDGPTLCITCNDSNAIPNLIEGCNCQDGYFMNEVTRECIKCSNDCSKCNNSNTCSECKIINSNLIDYNCICPENSYNNSNECICSDGYYIKKTPDIFECLTCQEPCLTCLSLNQCTSCKDKKLVVDKNYNCVPDCKERYYISNMECKLCLNLCKICSNENSCQQCVDNADNNRYGCFCKKGYIEDNGNCVEDYFYAVISISKLNKVGILFSEKTEYPLSSYSINITLSPAYNFSYKYFEINSTLFYLVFDFSSNIPKDTKVIVDLSSNSILSKSGKHLKQYIYSSLLYEYKIIENSIEIKNIEKKVSSSVKIIITISIGCGIISNPSSLWALLNTVQLVSYIPLSSNPLTPKLKVFLSSFGQYNIVPNAGYFIFSPNSSSEPYLEARRFGFQNSLFLLNTGQIFTNFFAVLCMWPLMLLISKLPYFSTVKKLEKLLSNYKYSFFIRFWIQAYLDIGICAIIQMRSVIYTQDILIALDGYFNIFSAVFCLVKNNQIIFALLPSVFFICSFLNKEEILGKSQDLMKKWGSFYTEFKIKNNFWSSQFYLFYFIRRLIYVFSQIYLNQTLYLQGGIQIFCSIFTLCYLFYYRPFKNVSVCISTIISEISMTMVFILIYLFLFDLPNEFYNVIESVIIGIVLASIIIQFLVSLFNACKSFHKAWKKLEYIRAKSFLNNVDKFNQTAFGDISQIITK
ncbi:hypothetical protein SteCoe_15853 [Stentor coeruleus]|uniref:EGF-like domain-containing protein n=1 Tax=Stentor coeruleus TaxID=5963 RepID=A0A1R2C2U4_9CILI|nr:hypothetical protein SteCoe_15853 [Stentor coeruleus]